MKLALAFLAALAAHFALRAAHLWWVLAAGQPLLLVVVAAARARPPVATAWMGLAVGLAIDLVSGRVIGPGGIAGAAAGAAVSLLVRRLELEGPLFWIVGSLAAAACSEGLWFALLSTLGVVPDHGWLGLAATVAMTAAIGLAVATVERGVRAWRSPERARRRLLKRL
ncbi:MAG TPA: hypothetical protein P5234_12970 [Thermoanaerobaculaceae bacterium]|nr:hypothetical protein [Thermoanaerobaculaceae bacterium]HRS17145.1 hypothetical protein [Thermoanaerobaculaceae bacterium]